MLLPKRTKFRKMHRGRLKGIATRANTVVFGDYGLQALEPIWLTSRQIEATRRSITRYVRRTGKIWIRVFPDKSVTERAAESRMGSGKGAVSYWVAVIKPGTVLFEIDGLNRETAYQVLKLAAYKLPIKTKIISREAVI
uniref:Large ribosomal subunit protein uL16c n=2 Tax=Isochrysidaceae TaxID=418951 RepID=A0A3S6R366_9EUKA|nr:ribosomal protein L16 [Tisochrysis lutea]YP_009873636.1 ribosomal protein L16 [Isochrysis galbana]AUM82545.1 ribosomal protein L16 [Tisochrysis lutea]QKW88519.1 ribosomal protein L16 [Isochrysis galbana]